MYQGLTEAAPRSSNEDMLVGEGDGVAHGLDPAHCRFQDGYQYAKYEEDHDDGEELMLEGYLMHDVVIRLKSYVEYSILNMIVLQ